MALYVVPPVRPQDCSLENMLHFDTAFEVNHIPVPAEVQTKVKASLASTIITLLFQLLFYLFLCLFHCKAAKTVMCFDFVQAPEFKTPTHIIEE